MNDNTNSDTLDLAKGHLDRFTQKQLQFWNYLYKNSPEIIPIQRSQIDPKEISSLLPFIWMANLIFDDSNRLIDVEPRLMGTHVVNLYGERTHEQLLTSSNEKALKNLFPANIERLTNALELMLKTNEPVFGEVEPMSDEKDFISIKGLMIPACLNSEQIDLVVGFNEGIT